MTSTRKPRKPKKRATSFRTNVSLPHKTLEDLREALLRRRVLSQCNGKKPPTTVAGWFRESADAFVKLYQ